MNIKNKEKKEKIMPLHHSLNGGGINIYQSMPQQTCVTK